MEDISLVRDFWMNASAPGIAQTFFAISNRDWHVIVVTFVQHSVVVNPYEVSRLHWNGFTVLQDYTHPARPCM